MLNEIKLYVAEPDPNFVRKSIKALCSIALRFKKSAEKYILFKLNNYYKNLIYFKYINLINL